MGSGKDAFAAYNARPAIRARAGGERKGVRFFELAEQLVRVGHSDAALDLIYDGVDALMRSGDLGRLAALLETADPFQSDVDVCIALLSASLPVRQSLPVRRLLYESLFRRLTGLGEDAPQALAGLD